MINNKNKQVLKATEYCMHTYLRQDMMVMGTNRVNLFKWIVLRNNKSNSGAPFDGANFVQIYATEANIASPLGRFV